jgi:uncharacterized protein (TIGR03000 family)
MFRSWFPTSALLALAVVLVAADFGEAARPRRRGNSQPVSRESFYYTAPPANSVGLNVRVPAPDAVITIDGERTTQTGLVRQYVSPPVTPGVAYTYQVKVTWTEDGRPMTRTRQVPVRANQQVVVDLTRETNDSRQALDD